MEFPSKAIVCVRSQKTLKQINGRARFHVWRDREKRNTTLMPFPEMFAIRSAQSISFNAYICTSRESRFYVSRVTEMKSLRAVDSFTRRDISWNATRFH